ncbi:hypothetical protein COOONC_24605, partial [Cooperia oncophora]
CLFQFPKFHNRITSAVKARSFGVKTVSDDKPYNLESSAQAGTEPANPSALAQEIAKLEDAMNSVERKVKEAEDYAAPFDSGVIHNGLSIPKSVEYTDETAPIADRRSSS